ncbi:hypothetical protein BD770DRAFT_439147 [Pilaira anomala]|nr:hypothetical protein BD770DRAFT_439147 [Pilaira anomala]
MDIDVFDLYDDPMDVDEASTNDASSPEEVVFVEYEGNIQIVQEAHLKTNSINHVTYNIQLDVHSSDASTVLLSSEEEEDDDDDDDEEEEDDDEEEEDDDEEDSEEEEEEEDPELESRVANFFQGLQTEIGL